MKRIWAPWRMKHISKEAKNGHCLFCQKPKERQDKENYLVFRGKHTYIMLNAYPYISGHLLIAPYRHLARFVDLKKEELTEMMFLAQRGMTLLEETSAPDGFNMGMNVGKTAGAGIDKHLHLHIVPRWEADTNFMPAIAQTKVLPELLETTYEKLREAIKKHPFPGSGGN